MNNLPPIPPQRVINEFELSGQPTQLEGGQGKSFLLDGVVLKPVHDIAESEWIGSFLSRVQIDGVRVPEPRPSRSGKWVVDGWAAQKYVAGYTVKGRWEEKIQLSRKFHQGLPNVSRPKFFSARLHPWAIADHMIWGETKLVYGPELAPVMDELISYMRPLEMKHQIIHGDMTGNILFDDSLPPAVIDFSPYWRPAEFATAIIIVDATVWEGASMTLLDEMANSYENNQLLLRALMWRIKTKEEFVKQYGTTKLAYEIDAYKQLIPAILARF